MQVTTTDGLKFDTAQASGRLDDEKLKTDAFHIATGNLETIQVWQNVMKTSSKISPP